MTGPSPASSCPWSKRHPRSASHFRNVALCMIQRGNHRMGRPAWHGVNRRLVLRRDTTLLLRVKFDPTILICATWHCLKAS